MGKFLNFLYKCSCCIILFFFGYVWWQSTSMVSHMEIISSTLTTGEARIMNLLGALTILGLLACLNHFLMKVSKRSRRVWLGILVCAGLALQLFMIFGMRASLQYDSLKPVDVAMQMMKGEPLYTSPYYDYFCMYPHNLSLIFFTFVIFKAAALLGVAEANYIIALQIVNLFLVDGAIWLLYRLIRKHINEKRAIALVLLCLFNPLMYYYPVFFYTKVFAGPFVVALLYLFFKAKEAKTGKQFICYGIIYGIVLYLAYWVRALSLIAPVACVILLILCGRFDLLKKKAFWGMLAMAMAMFLICSSVCGAVYEKYNLTTEEDRAFPMQHWFMMGLYGEGKFNFDDVDFSNSFATKEERAQAATEEILVRVKEKGISGLLDLWGRKITNTWSDGYDDYADNLRITATYEPYKDYIVDDRSEFLAAYMHMFHCMLCMLLVYTALKFFKRSQPDMMYTLCITIIGGMIFHTFWETSETYSMPFAQLILAGAAAGMELMDRPLELLLEKRKTNGSSESSGKRNMLQNRGALYGILAVLLLADVVFFGNMYSDLKGISYEAEEWAYDMNLTEGDKITFGAEDVFTQTALISRPFNSFSTYIKCDSKEDVEAEVKIRILDSAGECMYETTKTIGKRWVDCAFSFEELSPSGRSEALTIEILPLDVPKNCSVSLMGYNTGNWDVYPNGEAAVNGESLDKVDLAFSLCNRVVRTLVK